MEAWHSDNQTAGSALKNQHFFDRQYVNPLGVNISWVPLGFLCPSVDRTDGYTFGPVVFGLNRQLFLKMELERSMSLLQFMVDEGLVPPEEEETKRRNVLEKLKQIVQHWIKRVTCDRTLPRNYVRSASATVLAYGSYGLGVHSSESDIDAVCLGPHYATMAEDFFIGLHDMLASRPEVSEIHCIKDAKVPLMRFKFYGISIDLPYAQLKVKYVPEDVDILDPFFLRNIDETSWKSLSGIRANKSILRLVPKIELFQSLLRCMKLWAKRRGVYSSLLGFFGGVHLAVLAAFICQRYPTASLGALVSIFLETFAFWHWPMPVILQDGMMPPIVPAERWSLMPIQLPCSPYEFCHSNISRSTFYRIRMEFLRGYALTKDILRADFDWKILFQPFPYGKKYFQFIKIRLSASGKEELGDWVGWVKSRFRCLLAKLEDLQGFCDPNPTEFVDTNISEPNVVFYWGLQPANGFFLDIDSLEEDFSKDIINGYKGPSGKMKLSVVKASELHQKAQFNNYTGGKVRQECWSKVEFPKQKPQHFDGYLENNANAEYPSAGG